MKNIYIFVVTFICLSINVFSLDEQFNGDITDNWTIERQTISVQNGILKTSLRGTILSKKEYSAPKKIKLRVRSDSSFETFAVMVCTDGVTLNGFNELRGLQVNYSTDYSNFIIVDRETGKHSAGIEGVNIPQGTWVNLEIEDLGTSIKATLDDGNKKYEIEADVSDYVRTGNKVALYSRELGGGSSVDYFKIEGSEEPVSEKPIFQLIEGNFTWDEAKADAELRGGRLAIIDTPEKNSEVMSLDGNWGQHRAAFIGLTDRDTEGEWRWIDGSPLTWSNWKGGEPNDAGGEDVAAIVKNEGWNDEWVERNGEFNRQPYILELTTDDDPTFEIIEGNFTWDEAKIDAAERGGRLAVLDTKAKIESVNSTLEGLDFYNDMWIGLEGDGSVWRWTNGNKEAAPPWYSAFNASPSTNFAGYIIWSRNNSSPNWNAIPKNSKSWYVLELSSEPKTSLDDGLVAYYPFNGNANDESGNGLNFKTTPKLSTDRNGESESTSYLDSSETFSTSDLSLSGSNFSGSVWVYLEKTPSSQGERALVHGSWDNSTGLFSLAFWGDGRGGISTRDSQILSEVIAPSGTFSQKQWYHLSFTSDGENLSFYIDGELFSSIKSNLKTTKSAPLSIGGDIANSYYFDSGKIDDVRIYDRALSAGEVSELYELEKPEPTLEDGLVAYYPFNGNANDESGNGNDGVVDGATLASKQSREEDTVYYFDGNDGIDFGDVLDIGNGNFTMSLWVKPSDRDLREQVIIAKGQSGSTTPPESGYMILNDRGKYVIRYNDDQALGLAAVAPIKNLDTWDHLVYKLFRQDGNSTLTLFLNGEQVAFQTKQVGPSNSEQGLSFGYHNKRVDPKYHFLGELDNVRFYDRALSASEVSKLYELEKPTLPDPSPPVVSFDEFYEALPDETITIDATPKSGFPEDFTYQWYFGTFLIPEVLGGKSNTFDISSNEENNGVWTVKISNSAGSTESSFYFAAYKDTDGDGISDGREEYVIGSDPTLADTDGDGLKDYDEVYTYGTSFSKADTDGDGFDDIFEISTKYDPLSSESTPEAYLEIQTAVEIKFNAGKNLSYKIENSVDLENWNAIETGVVGEGKLVKRLYSIDDYKGRYFRVRREEK